MIDREPNQTRKRRPPRLTGYALLYFTLAIIAFGICATNMLAMLAIFWKPRHLLLLPLYMMLGAASLWAGIHFLQTRSRLLTYGEEPDNIDE